MFNFNEMFGKTRNDLKIINKDLENLNSKKIAVIGGTGGIGRALANSASNRGAEVIVVGRTFRENPETSKIKFVQADLSSMKTSLSIAKKLEAKNLDIVIMTQGIFSGRTKQVTEEGIELDMAVSHLSRFVILRHLVLSLGKNLKSEQAKPRVFIMGFPGGYREVNIDDFNSEKSYDWKQAHYNTVVANEALVLDSVERFTNVNFFGLNPGLIKSQILTNLIGEGLFFRFQQMMLGWFFQSDAEYAQKILHMLVTPDIENHSGSMFDRNGNPIHVNPVLEDKSIVVKIIEKCENLVEKSGLSLKNYVMNN